MNSKLTFIDPSPIDWGLAPEWAKFAACDRDGWLCFYRNDVTPDERSGQWGVDEELDDFVRHKRMIPDDDWKLTKTRRPPVIE